MGPATHPTALWVSEGTLGLKRRAPVLQQEPFLLKFHSPAASDPVHFQPQRKQKRLLCAGLRMGRAGNGPHRDDVPPAWVRRAHWWQPPPWWQQGSRPPCSQAAQCQQRGRRGCHRDRQQEEKDRDELCLLPPFLYHGPLSSTTSISIQAADRNHCPFVGESQSSRRTMCIKFTAVGGGYTAADVVVSQLQLASSVGQDEGQAPFFPPCPSPGILGAMGASVSICY